MSLQLMNTLCTMQYLISVGFPKDPGKRADQRRCAAVASFSHCEKNQLKVLLREQLITSVVLIYFTVINPVRS